MLKTTINGEELIINKYEPKPIDLINKSIIFYGPSNSGKTQIIRDFMFLTKKYFPIAFAFAPTNAEKHDYDSIIPQPLVYEKFDLNDINNIYKRQKIITEIYNNANNIKILKSIYKKIGLNNIYDDMFKRIEKVRKNSLEMIEKEEGDKKTKIDNLEYVIKTKLNDLYKNIIKKHKIDSSELTEQEQYAVKYININPNVLIVFDDAMTEILSLIKEGKRKNDEVLKDFFYKGRWANITHWYAFHDDKNLDSDIRKNAFISIFTNKQVASTYFARSANGFSNLERKKAEAAIKLVFENSNPEMKYAKLIYDRINGGLFKYYIATLHEDKDISMCSESLKKFCKEISTNKAGFDVTNPYFSKFKEF